MPLTPRDTEQTLVGTAWLPGYEVLALVGAGGHGQVFKARQLALDRVVAVKLVHLDPAVRTQLASRFEREAVALGRFHHPNIVPVFDYGRHGDHLFMAMELLEGEDLGSRVRRDGRLDERTAWQIARQAAAGLAHALGHGVIHRDVKPANLFLVPAPTGLGLPDGVPMVKVLDFGLARGEVGMPEREQTAHGVIVGTPAYMAPEQANGDDLDHRADVYALGATVYHALTGRAPFAGRTVWEVMAKKVEQKFPPLGELSSASAGLVRAMMEPDPAKRIASYEDLIARIDRLLGAKPARTAPGRLAAYWPHAVTVAGVAAALAIGLVYTRGPIVEAKDHPAPRFVGSGRIESLFDGSLDHWSPSSGSWCITKDDEAAKVIRGTGTLRRSFAAADRYRITIGLDIYEATAAEVQFAIPAGGTGRRFVLRVCRESEAVLGMRDGDRGPFTPTGTPVPFPSPHWFKDRRPYLEVRIERVADTFSAWFNGDPAGHLTCDGTDPLPEVRLCAQGGAARIDSAVFEK